MGRKAYLPGMEGALLDVVELALGSDDAQPFRTPVLDALRRLVGCDALSYREWTSDGGTYDNALSADDAGARNAVWAHYPLFAHEDAIPCGAPRGSALPTQQQIGVPLLLEDVLSERRFRNTGLYAEICRPFGIRSVLKLYLPHDGVHASGFVFDRSTRRFATHETESLVRLLPVFVAARRNARIRRASAQLDVLTMREREVLGRVTAGETNEQIAAALFVGPSTIRKHMEHILEKLEANNRAQAAAIFAAACGEFG